MTVEPFGGRKGVDPMAGWNIQKLERRYGDTRGGGGMILEGGVAIGRSMERFRSDSWELCRYRNQITLIRVLSVLYRTGKKDGTGRRIAGVTVNAA